MYHGMVFFLCCVLALCHSSGAEAARLPNSLVKTVLFRGETALEIALLMGIEHDQETERTFPLGDQDSWAIALREHPQDPSRVVNTGNINRLHYVPKPQPSLSIESNWLGSHTGSSPATPRYFFSSPVISENSPHLEWVRLLQTLLARAQHSPKADGSYWEIVSEEMILRNGTPVFSVIVYQPRDKEVFPKRRGYFLLIRANDPD